MLSGRDLRVSFGAAPVLADLNVEFGPGTISAVVGPNGSGKSTLLRALARLLRPTAGGVYLDGEAINSLSSRAVARRLAMLPQGPSSPEGLRVRELVEQGRYPHAGPLRMLRHQDHSAVADALGMTEMEHLADRPVGQLSGGERQRAWIAAALAQATPLLLLDEPTTFLDVRYQLEVLELVESLNRDRGITIVMALHDLNHAARYASRILAMGAGRIVADGKPQDILTERNLTKVFGVRASILTDPATGTIVCLPHSVARSGG